MNLLLFLLPIVVLVLLMRQQQRRLRQHQALIASLEVGDDVVTASGIYGTITALDGDIAMLEVAPGVTLKVATRAVAGVLGLPPAGGEVDEDVDEGEQPGAGPVQDAS
jgi:preprotein translocase subunit YajC